MKTAADAFRALEERCDIAFYITPKGKELISKACGYRGDKATKPTAAEAAEAASPEPVVEPAQQEAPKPVVPPSQTEENV